MLKKIAVFSFLTLFFLSFSSCSRSDGFPVLQGEFMGQAFPGAEPELFAPGIVSTGMYERDVAMTPDGREMYFGLMFGQYVTIFYSRLENGRWTEPEVASFASDPRFQYFEPHITFDGKQMLFLCTHPPAGKDPKPGWFYQNIWAVDRLDDGRWGEIYDIGAPVNTDDSVYFPSTTKDGTLYFTRSKRGAGETNIMRSRWQNGKYQEPEILPEAVNGKGNVYNAFIATDESYLIACVEGRDDSVTPGLANYYIFYRDENDNWNEGINLGEKINLPGIRATSAYVSPDGRFLFFGSSKVKSQDEITERGLTFDWLKKIHNEPQNGNSDIYGVESKIFKE